jgi:hypothetical protein
MSSIHFRRSIMFVVGLRAGGAERTVITPQIFKALGYECGEAEERQIFKASGY